MKLYHAWMFDGYYDGCIETIGIFSTLEKAKEFCQIVFDNWADHDGIERTSLEWFKNEDGWTTILEEDHSMGDEYYAINPVEVDVPMIELVEWDDPRPDA